MLPQSAPILLYTEGLVKTEVMSIVAFGKPKWIANFIPSSLMNAIIFKEISRPYFVKE